MHKITHNGDVLAIKFATEDIKPGLSFFSEENDFIQVGSWRYEKGKVLAAHQHNFVDRKVNRTQEFIFVISGSLKATVYDEYQALIEELVLKEMEGMIMLRGCHGYEILSDDTVVLETKNGPYLGAEIDRKRI